MQIVTVEGAVTPLPKFYGNIVTNGVVANYITGDGTMWSIPPQLLEDIRSLQAASQAELTAEVSEVKPDLSVTDLLALNRSFSTDEILKLREGAIL